MFSNADDDPNRLVNVTEGIGTALEQEAQMQFYERECPGLFEYNQEELLAEHNRYTAEVCHCSYNDEPV